LSEFFINSIDDSKEKFKTRRPWRTRNCGRTRLCKQARLAHPWWGNQRLARLFTFRKLLPCPTSSKRRHSLPTYRLRNHTSEPPSPHCQSFYGKLVCLFSLLASRIPSLHCKAIEESDIDLYSPLPSSRQNVVLTTIPKHHG
jgi:hypothetical protein